MSNTRRPPTAAAIRLLLAKAMYRCSFPGCGAQLLQPGGMSIAEICHIETMTTGGARYNSELDFDSADAALDNLIVLCPNHHHLVDSNPELYSGEWLKSARDRHENAMSVLGNNSSNPSALGKKLTNLHEALKIWKANKTNGDEEFWHQLFKKNPKIIAQSMPNCAIQIADKSYVGGKGLSNSGGKIVDFVYATKSTQNTVIVEIKTPTTKLVGCEYRTDIFSINEELSGAIVQTLIYRNQLVKNFHSLRMADPSISFEVYDPICVVIAGNLELEGLSAAQRSSLELFRANAGVTVITYDELFAKVQELVDMFD